MDLCILAIEDEDLKIITEMEQSLFKKAWTESDYLYELHENPYAHYLKLIIKETKEIIGYIGFWITFETSQITKIAVCKKYQGHKLSKLLMSDTIRRLENANCENITLEVRVSNEVAINLYKSCGFTIVTTRKHYYENGEDAYLMIKELKK